MTATIPAGTITVGLDGSLSAGRALGWAAVPRGRKACAAVMRDESGEMSRQKSMQRPFFSQSP